MKENISNIKSRDDLSENNKNIRKNNESAFFFFFFNIFFLTCIKCLKSVLKHVLKTVFIT